MYCEKCGSKLEKKFLELEGMVPYCNNCKDYRFPKFNSAVSMIIFNPDETKTLYVKQYGTGKFRLVAGYLEYGESLEHAVFREMSEEIGRIPASIKFNASKYYAPSGTLMNNFICKLTTEELHTNSEIDEYEWVDIKDMEEKIRPASLAHQFVEIYLSKK